MDRMESAKLRTVNLTDNDLAKDHLRYFVSYIFYTHSCWQIILSKRSIVILVHF
jgi:hypothetical protein